MTILDKTKVIEDYLSLKSLKKVAKKHYCSSPTISKLLHKNNIPLFNTREIQSFTSTVKKKINENYFKNIDTEAKAYFLGFIAADGCNSHKNCVEIKLNSKDESILYTLKKEIQSDHKIIKTNEKTTNSSKFNYYSKFRFSNLTLSTDLRNHGIVKKKSNYLKFPTTVPNNLINHFIRGYFDGDGSISTYNRINKDKSNYLTINIAIISTKNFIEELIRTININTNIKMGIKNHKNKISSYATLGGNIQVLSFYNWMYKNSTFFLERKKKKFEDFIEIQKIKENNNIIIQLTENGDFIKEWKSLSEISTTLFISKSALCNCLNKKTKTCLKYKWFYKKELKK